MVPMYHGNKWVRNCVQASFSESEKLAILYCPNFGKALPVRIGLCHQAERNLRTNQSRFHRLRQKTRFVHKREGHEFHSCHKACRMIAASAAEVRFLRAPKSPIFINDAPHP
jgi:hypothetical protein